MTSLVKLLYTSPNGDSWSLHQGETGELLVIHQPNRASGGAATHVALDAFIARGGSGPEHQALSSFLENQEAAGQAGGDPARADLTAETVDRLLGALGQAVGRRWSSLPADVQQDLFEAAVRSAGEPMRHSLAIFLHWKHARTLDAVHARAMSEPDSLGG